MQALARRTGWEHTAPRVRGCSVDFTACLPDIPGYRFSAALSGKNSCSTLCLLARKAFYGILFLFFFFFKKSKKLLSLFLSLFKFLIPSV